jgi:hypothetical protein
MKFWTRLVIFVAIMLIMQTGWAAPPDPECDPLDPACPIDGGVGLLIAAGVGLGAKALFRKK